MSLSATSGSQSRELAQALGRAAESGDAARACELLAQGAAADARLEGGATALMRAAARGYADVARALLDAGADVNARRADGFSPLVLAVFFGHEEVVRLLLERGAHAGSPTRLGVTARGWAESRGFASIGELLKDAPAPPAEAQRRTEPAPARPAAPDFSPFDIRVGGRGPEAKAPPPAPPAAAREPRPADDPTFAPRTYEPKFQTPPRGFLGSWQASVGVFLLVVACGVAAFAVWQNRRGATRPDAPAQAPAPAPQAAQPPPGVQPTPDLAAQPTPSPDAQGGAILPGMPGEVIVQPYMPYQPAPVQPEAPAAAAGAPPTDPAVVSEGGAGAAEPGPRREGREARDEAPASAPPAGRRDDARPSDDARADDAARRDASPDAETRPAQPAYNPPPAPSPTPRARVIQWPPQE